MSKYNNVAILVIGGAFSFLGFILGISFSMAEKDIAGIMVMAYIIGMSVGPTVVYEFGGPWLKIYMVAGPVGLAFIKLSLKIFECDNKITENEIEKLKKYVSKEFGEEIGIAAEKFVNQNKNIKENTFNICKPLIHMSYSERIGVISQLFAMAYSDGDLCEQEELMMQKISHYLHIGKKRYNIIKSNYYYKYHAKDTSANNQNSGYRQKNEKSNQFLNRFFIPTYNPYLILGLENSASVEEIKKTYRDLAKKYHPDVQINKSEQYKKITKEKFLEINQAYETIKKIRGIK